MPRAERERRRRIADAASGLRRRPAVVLYLCVPGPPREAEVARLEAYARERGIRVTGTVVDLVDPASPVEERPGWRSIRELVLTHQVTGVLTETADMCGATPAEHGAVLAWLADHAADLTVLPAPVDRGAPTTPVASV
ncbi:hypothetical protein [Streptomyces sp. RFCAC02]|uniref:hypothetical protein n=1 Tax=Streptomyces sp. RFCAC02 TaxID=2499143 RepID=UPI0010205066|nr:hypothetical protein [Streptomyces sp. RFCAC02]